MPTQPTQADLHRHIVIRPDAIEDILIEGRGDGARTPPLTKSPVLEGDPILRQRIARVLARDCARRKLCTILLPALTNDARAKILDHIASWPAGDVKDAAMEVVKLTWETFDTSGGGWPNQ